MHLQYGIKNKKGVIFARFEFETDRDNCFYIINQEHNMECFDDNA